MASTSSLWNAVQKRLSLAEKVWSEETGTFDGLNLRITTLTLSGRSGLS